MSFTWQDAIEKVSGGNNFTLEISHSKDTQEVKGMTPSEIRNMFPDVKFSNSDHVIYFPTKMCHSLPKVNDKGRCFSLKVLINSCESAQDSLIDVEHQLKNNGVGDYDNICGHIKAVQLGISKEAANNNEITELPVPLYALGTLYMRHSNVPSIVENYIKGNKRWYTSMECGHLWTESALYYENEFIPFKDAPGDMLECIERNRVRPYKGKELSVALGGKEGSVEFLGLGMTLSPADNEGDVLALVAGKSLEVANTTRTHFMPLRLNFLKNSEDTQNRVDGIFNELASISVLGETEPSEDGHKHQILSDGTVMPSNGHVHSLSNWSISKGTKPRLTGRTGDHYERIKSTNINQYGEPVFTEHVHLHLVNIELRGSKKTTEGTIPSETELSSLISKENEMKIEELLNRLSASVEKLSSGKDNDAQTELSSIREDLRKINASNELKETVEKEIASKLEDGELIKKEEHEKILEDERNKIRQEEEEKRKREEQKRERKEKVSSLGLNLDHKFDDEEDSMTLGEIVDSIDTDEKGEKEFTRNFTVWKSLAQNAKKEQEQNTKEKEQKEAASKKVNPPLLVGGGETSSTETASTESNGRKRGKNAITSV